MAYNQGGIQDIREISGAQAMNMSSLQRTSMPAYHFLDITRANFGKGSETAATRSFNAGELFFDNNAVGLNPFFKAPETATKIFTA